MATKWDQLFGAEFFFTITNEERRYMGLNAVEDGWDMLQFYSKTNFWHKRTSIFFDGDRIKKVVKEEKQVVDGKIIFEDIAEYDTNLQTENREWLLPQTTRGKKKKVTATNVLAVDPFGCEFYFTLDSGRVTSAHMGICNYRNNKRIAIGEEERISKIRNDTDFHEFMKYYMETCPEDYFEKIRELRDSRHITVKYKTGDIFKVEVDRFRYCYGIITGQVREIQRWKELPEFHSLRSLMLVPVMVRFYGICTTDGRLSVDELAGLPLGRVQICGDNDIIWGTHEIIGHRELKKEDIEFNLVCTKIQKRMPFSTVHTYDSLLADGIYKKPESYQLYVEWGTAATILPCEQISEKLKKYLQDYHSPHGGICRGIENMALLGEKSSDYRNNLLNDRNREMREELFHCLQLKSDADFDDFAGKYGGLTKEEILRKMQCEKSQ